MENNNPLPDFSGLPRFNEIKPERIKPAMDYMLNRNRNQIAKLTASSAALTWQNFMRPLGRFIRSPSAFVGTRFPFEQGAGYQ